MRKFLLLLTLSMICKEVLSGFMFMYRCENDEIICYIYDKMDKGDIFCKFKNSNVTIS